MTLESQRRILTSLEPAAGLELLLLNLALLPRLLPLGDLNPDAPAGGERVSPPVSSEIPESRAGARSGQDMPRRAEEESAGARRPFAEAAASSESSAASSFRSGAVSPASVPERPEETAVSPRRFLPPEAEGARRFAPPSRVPEAPSPARQPVRREKTDDVPPWLDEIPAGGDPALKAADGAERQRPADGAGSASGRAVVPSPECSRPAALSAPSWTDTEERGGKPEWEDFLTFCEDREGVPLNLLRQCAGEIEDGRLRLHPRSQTVSLQLQRHAEMLRQAAESWAGRPLEPEFMPPRTERRTSAELRSEMQDHPVVQELSRIFGATLVHCAQADRN